MFARVIKGKRKEYVSIVRGYRDREGKVKQKTVSSLDPLTLQTKAKTLEIANAIVKISGNSKDHKQCKRYNRNSEIELGCIENNK